MKQKLFEYLVPFWNYSPSYGHNFRHLVTFSIFFLPFQASKSGFVKWIIIFKVVQLFLRSIVKKIEYIVPFWNYWPSYDVRHFLQRVLDFLLFMSLTVTFTIKTITVKDFKLYFRGILKKIIWIPCPVLKLLTQLWRNFRQI